MGLVGRLLPTLLHSASGPAWAQIWPQTPNKESVLLLMDLRNRLLLLLLLLLLRPSGVPGGGATGAQPRRRRFSPQ